MGALNADIEGVVQLGLLDAALHKDLLDELDEGICMVDRDHRIVYWNRGAEHISGFLAHEVAGQFSHGDLLLHCESDGSLLPGAGPESPVLAAMRDGKPHETSVFLLHREGHRLLVQLQAHPIRDADGGIAGVLEVFEEIAAPLYHRARELEDFGCADTSTHAANRRFGEMMVGHALEALNVFEIPFGWLRIGLDKAEELHRAFGQGMVEAAVRMIAATLNRSLGPLDVLTRWDTTEFRVEVSRCSHSELAASAERLRLLVRASTLEWWGDRRGVTVSIGGMTAEPGDTIETLEQRTGEVYEGCQASGGDRAAIAHWHRTER
ncbi:MAG TPA: PAS domain-containing protein [Bryobacteraceae bacterium]|nr:PAS domain-containing protein [Bryobacteraceae bacterium]